MKQHELFFVSALCFLIANNLHFITDNGLIPRVLDVVAMAAFFWGAGLYFWEKKKSQS
ncbi:MAG: hypothetical protein U5L10_02225 [Candidatus Moranbacteria bacterium]|nr:hypothetical protein [Candidatus Moranbacteria bacterium]